MLFFIRYYLWIAPNLLLLITLLWIFLRNWQRQYRVFVAYLFLQLAYFVCGFTIDSLGARHPASRATYLWILIVGVVLSALLELGVLYQLAVALIFSRLTRAKQLRAVLRWSAGILVLLGVVIAASLAWTSPEHLLNISQTVNIAAYSVAFGLLLTIVVLAKVLSIPLRSLSAGIALGFGIAAAGEMAGSGVLSELGKNKNGYIAADLVRMSAFHVCALIWLIYVLVPNKQPLNDVSSISATDLESRTKELQRMMRR